MVVDISNGAKDFIEKEVSAFYRSPDNSLYMLPATPQVCITARVISESYLLSLSFPPLSSYLRFNGFLPGKKYYNIVPFLIWFDGNKELVFMSYIYVPLFSFDISM